MTQSLFEKTASDLIYLVSCAVNCEKPDPQRCADADLEQLYTMANAHALTSVTAHALAQVTELPRPFDQAMKKAIRKLALFNIERAKLTSALESAGIRYLPLKGIILKEYYPKTAMREMSDNDILCDESRAADVRTIMERLGYTCEMYGQYHHDTYQKPPSLEFEIHRTLFSKEDLPLFAAYYADIRDRLILSDNSRYGYRMTDEDFYIYLLCHLYKHYHFSGTGLRSLLDVYVFCKARYETLDKEYLAAQLKQLELEGFEKDLRQLSDAVFNGRHLDEDQQKELLFFLQSGCYGNARQQSYLSVQRNLGGDDSRQAKRRYLVRRIFPSVETLEKRYPAVSRHKSLYPLILIYRPIKGAFTRPKGILKEYRSVKAFKKNNDHGSHNG